MNNQPTIQKNHMDILWHEFADKSDTTPITGTSLPAKASVIGRVGIMMLACGTGAWRVRSSMNTLSGHCPHSMVHPDESSYTTQEDRSGNLWKYPSHNLQES